ncbi:MAG: adenylosuccinate lyase, partial [Actinomycetes bacterium]
IREHAVAVALEMRQTGRSDNDLFDRLAADPRLGLSRAELEAAVTEPLELAGVAGQQVAAVVERVEEVAARHPAAAAYEPGLIL